MSKAEGEERLPVRGTRLDEPLPAVELSIEVFPPKGPEAATRLSSNLELFAAAAPRFISVTCGAGGSGEDGTFPLACSIQERFGVPVAAHLTCAYSSRAAIDALVQRYWDQGIRRIVALRGDAPKGAARYEPRPDGYAYATDLVAGLKRVADFEISVGCYPEVHPEAESAEGGDAQECGAPVLCLHAHRSLALVRSSSGRGGSGSLAVGARPGQARRIPGRATQALTPRD